MWSLARRDLKVRLTLRIAVLSALCFVLAALAMLFDADHAAGARIAAAATVAARDLELQRSKMDWIAGAPTGFPDLQEVAASLMAPGLCIAYRPDGGELLQRFCGGGIDGDPPAPFGWLYRALFHPGRQAVRPVLLHGGKIGEAVAWIDGRTATAQAWKKAAPFLAVTALTLALLCVLVHGALATLAETLESALGERKALTRRLIALQDEERRHLARELHDEFGQSLAAIRALAAAGRSAECAAIEHIAAGMSETLRGALFRLRPPDLDELGLAASLEGLVAGWNGRGQGRTRFEIALGGGCDGLPENVSAGLYRIAQEAITNAAKHAQATRVLLSLAERSGDIELIVDDDGKAAACVATVAPGLGLLGMRERAAALGGRLSFAAKAEAGTQVRVVIPRRACRP